MALYVLPDFIETDPTLAKPIANSLKTWGLNQTDFESQILSRLATISHRPFVTLIYDEIESVLFPMEMIQLEEVAEERAAFAQHRRQWLGELLDDDEVHYVTAGYRELLAVIATSYALFHPKVASTWSPIIAQRIAARTRWEEAIVKAETARRLASHGRRPQRCR